MPNTAITTPRALRVLIAEDHDEFRRLLVDSFRVQGYLVAECRHGIELIGQLRCLEDPAEASEFDLIISDIRMPGVTGMSVLAGLREFKNIPPVILITAFGDEETHAEAQRLGVAAMIDKPFEISDLLSRAQAILRSLYSSGKGGRTGDGQIAAAGTSAAPASKSEA